MNASHEFLSPLTSIAAAAHVLSSGGDEPEVRARFVGNIVAAANRLITTSRALLVLARAEAGAEPPRLELLRPEAAARRGVLRRGRWPISRCGSCARCARSCSPIATCSALALGALRDNACRHGGRTPINVEVAELDGGRLLSIEIGSTGGAGRGDLDLDRLTERFVSGEGRDSGGFGIGLSIAERARAARRRPSPASGRRRRGSGRGWTSRRGQGRMNDRILLVEDEPAISDAVAYTLRSSGYDVDVLPDGEQALRRYARLRPARCST